MFLEAHFGEVELHRPEELEETEHGEDNNEPSLLVRLDEAYARINLVSMVRLVRFAYCSTLADIARIIRP
jgi:hypothetical protein